MSLVVTGSIGIDSIETPEHSVDRVLGGSCAYFAAAASVLTPLRMVAAIGDDWPNEHETLLRRFDIDLTGLEKRAGAKTFVWSGKYLDNMNIRETTYVEVNILGEAPPPVPDSFADSAFVFLANTDPGSQLTFANSFPNKRLVVADTMDLWINTDRDRLNELLNVIDGLVLNDSESTLMTNEKNPITAAKLIRTQYNLRFVLVKKGEHGAILVHEDGIAALPAFPAEMVVDPTGAGDSFAGGFMGHLANADNDDFSTMQHAMAIGTVMASFTIESFSLDTLANLTPKMFKQRFDHYAQMVRV